MRVGGGRRQRGIRIALEIDARLKHTLSSIPARQHSAVSEGFSQDTIEQVVDVNSDSRMSFYSYTSKQAALFYTALLLPTVKQCTTNVLLIADTWMIIVSFRDDKHIERANIVRSLRLF